LKIIVTLDQMKRVVAFGKIVSNRALGWQNRRRSTLSPEPPPVVRLSSSR
jgi:hypothetical protein